MSLFLEIKGKNDRYHFHVSSRFEFHPREEVCFRKVAFRTQKTMDRDVIRTQKYISRRRWRPRTGRSRRSLVLVDFIPAA